MKNCCSKKVDYSNYIKKEEVLKPVTKKSKISSIIEGWKNLLFRSNETNEVIISRSKICYNCDKNISKFCKLCGCFIPAKINSLQEKCPLNKW
jgi:hypothetical protein